MWSCNGLKKEMNPFERVLSLENEFPLMQKHSLGPIRIRISVWSLENEFPLMQKHSLEPIRIRIRMTIMKS